MEKGRLELGVQRNVMGVDKVVWFGSESLTRTRGGGEICWRLIRRCTGNKQSTSKKNPPCAALSGYVYTTETSDERVQRERPWISPNVIETAARNGWLFAPAVPLLERTPHLRPTAQRGNALAILHLYLYVRSVLVLCSSVQLTDRWSKISWCIINIPHHGRREGGR